MVRHNYAEFEEKYQEIINTAKSQQGCSILILVAYDIDAMAAARMLCGQLRQDGVTYQRNSVMNFEEVKAVVRKALYEDKDNAPDIKTIFLLNCGATYDLPKHFNLEFGSDVRCYILDHHRPVHLKNIHSRENVVVFDENYDENYEDVDDVPSEASAMSSDVSDSDEDSLATKEEAEDGDEEEDLELDEEEALLREQKASRNEEEFDENNEEPEEAEENADEAEDEADEVEGDENDDDGNPGEDEAEEVPEEEAEKEDLAADDEKDEEEEDEADQEVESLQREEEKSLVASEDEEDDQPRKVVKRKTHTLQEEDMDVEEIEAEGEHDRTFVADWNDREAADHDEDDDNIELNRTRNLDDADEEEEAEANEEDIQDEENGEDGEEDSYQMIGKRKRRQQELDHRRQKRQRIQQYYRRAITHATPTALMLLPFIRGKYAQVPLDMIWQSIIGVTDQFQRGNIPESAYDEYCHYIQMQLGDHLASAAERVRYTVQDTHVSNLTNPDNTNITHPNNNNSNTVTSTAVTVAGSQKGHIEEVADYRFFLYRHWSLYESMRHSPYIASRFTIWNAEGTHKFHELFAKMGVPLAEGQQLYRSMKPEVRKQFRNQILIPEVQGQYRLLNPTVTFKSFHRFIRYKNAIAANDIVQAALAYLEVYSYDATMALPLEDETHDNNKENDYLLNQTETDEGETQSQLEPFGRRSSRNSSLFYHPTRSSNKDLFNVVCDELLSMNETLLMEGIQKAIETQQTIAKKAFAMMEGHSIQRFHRVYYAYLFSSTSTAKKGVVPNSSSSHGQHGSLRHHNSTSSNHTSSGYHRSEVMEKEFIFGRPNVLARLGQFIMEVKRNLPKKLGGWTGQYLLPLILLSERQDSSFLVMGISPFSCISNQLEDITEEQKQKLAPLINFKQFFKLAAKDMGIKIRFISFDANVIEVQKDDVHDFLGALNNALKKATPTYFSNHSASHLANL